MGQVGPLWLTIMNNIVYGVGGALNFGLYGLSLIIQGAIGVIPTSFSHIIYPRMAIMMGEGKSVSYILRANIKPLLIQFVLLLTLSLGGAVLLPIIVPIVLPKYTAGIRAAQWMLFVPVTQSFGALNNIYNVVKKQKWYFVSLLTGAIIGSLYILWRVKKSEFQLEFFPQALLIGTLFQQGLSLYFLTTLTNKEKEYN